MKIRSNLSLLAGSMLLCALPVHAADWRGGGKLLLTRGVQSVDGAAGGGLATWALIAGNETRDGVGGSAAITVAALPDYDLRVFSGAVGLFDRLELSFARQDFDTGKTGAALGIGRGFTFNQDVWGAKLRVIGDAVYDQDTALPQIAIGVQYKHNRDAVVRAVGAQHRSDTDFYVAATKVLLAQSLVISGTARLTRSNQFGLLGYGGDKSDKRTLQGEASVGYLVTRKVLVGGEYRTKPDKLGFAKEKDAYDLFVAWAPVKNLSLTAAYVDLGPIATFTKQRGLYLSAQAAF